MQEKKNPSTVEKLEKVSLDIGNKLGKIATEFFMGKQPTEEDKERIRVKKERQKILKDVQEEARFKKDLELAKSGQYVPPVVEQKKKKKEGIGDIFSNIGKYNPLDGFNSSPSLGSQNFGLDGIGTKKNPLGKEKNIKNW